MSNWINIGPLDDIPARGARVVTGPEGDIAIFRTGDGNLFAIKDECPHRQGPLSQGMVFGDKVACPLHNWSIELATGEASAPDEGCTDSYPVRVSDGTVELCMTPGLVA